MIAKICDEEQNGKINVETYTRFGKRHMQACLCFVALVISFGLKSSMSVSIVAMTDTSNTNPNIPTYNWNEGTIGIIMSSSFWAYILSPYIATLTITRFGARIPLLISVVGLTILIFLFPTFAAFGWEWVCVNRCLQGFTQGYFLPCVMEIMAKWSHPLERGRLIGLVFFGTCVGPVLMIGMSGLIASSEIGWPGIFYISGTFCSIWLFFWLLMSKNAPEDHPTISKQELKFIQSMPGNESKKANVPWKHILQSKPFWALLLCMTSHTVCYNFLLAFIPTYIDRVLNFSIEANGFISALPYLIMGAFNILTSNLSDFLLSKKCVSMNFSRKLYNSIGMWIPGICLIILGSIDVDVSAAISLFCISVGTSSAIHSGFLVNYADVSPNFAGFLIGITQCVANFVAFFAPIFVGNIVTDFTVAKLWSIPFSAAGTVYLFCNLFFILFGKTDVQHWN